MIDVVSVSWHLLVSNYSPFEKKKEYGQLTCTKFYANALKTAS
jgi:hypothetical protein